MKPTPGQYYTAVLGDTLPAIAARAYGVPEMWTRIRNANSLQYKTNAQETVSPGEILFIPYDPDITYLYQTTRKI